MKNQQLIRNQVLRGITLNREPGYHFVGNFLDVSFDHISVEAARLSTASATCRAACFSDWLLPLRALHCRQPGC